MPQAALDVLLNLQLLDLIVKGTAAQGALRETSYVSLAILKEMTKKGEQPNPYYLSQLVGKQLFGKDRKINIPTREE